MDGDGVVPNVDMQPSLNAALFDALPSLSEREAELGSADAGWICRCDDGAEYVIKDGTSKSSTALVPHCEWFCTELSELVHIAAPQHKIIRKLDGTLVFGSRYLGGLINPDDLGGYWFDRVKAAEVDLNSLVAVLSHIYAFDHFIYNGDRHRWNFMLQKHFDSHALIAFDYSRAWFSAGFPLKPIPMEMYNNTVAHQRWLRDFWQVVYIDPLEVDTTLIKLRKIPKSRIQRILDDQPNEWLSVPEKDAILAWWGSAEMLARLDAISEGVKNETCL